MNDWHDGLITVQSAGDNEDDPITLMRRQSAAHADWLVAQDAKRRAREQELAFPGLRDETRRLIARRFTSRWEVARTPDAALLRIRQIGPARLAEIRAVYPFDPTASAIQDHMARVETLTGELTTAVAAMLTMLQEAALAGTEATG